MTARAPIPSFQLANPLYKNAQVSYYTVAGGVKTATLAVLYADTTSVTELPNPQKLNSQGQFKQPVYVGESVIGEVTGISVPGHDTAVFSPVVTFRVEASTGKIQYSYDGGTTWNDTGAYTIFGRGAWVTVTLYHQNNVVSHAGATYLALSEHTSGVFATDLAAGKWMLLISLSATALTQNRIPYVAADGTLQDSANLTFNGTVITLLGSVSVSGNASVGNAAIAGSANVGGVLLVGGNANVGGALNMTGGINGGAGANITLNTNKFVVNAATGDVAAAGNMTVPGATVGTGGLNLGEVPMDITANQVITSNTTMAPLAGLSFNIAANERWNADWFLPVVTDWVNGGANVSLTVPAGANLRVTAQAIPAMITNNAGNYVKTTTGNGSALGFLPGGPVGANFSGLLFVTAQIRNGANAGTAALLGSQQSSSANTLVFLDGAHGKAVRKA